jgi:hypothetical protein
MFFWLRPLMTTADQDRRAPQRSPEGLSITLEAGLQRERRAQLFFDLLDGTHHLADCGAWHEIE